MEFTTETACFEKWYGGLRAYTTPSTLLFVEQETKRALLHQMYWALAEEIPYFTENHPEPSVKGVDVSASLDQLECQIDDILQGQTMFFRTNLMSPKDVPGGCFVTTGKETLDLLTTSYRTYKGVRRFLGEEEFYLVFREKEYFLQEYRVFVQDGRVKAVSQYDDSTTLTENKGASSVDDLSASDRGSLLTYLEEVIRESGIRTTVLDIGATREGYRVIECNPFHRLTDLCLFGNTNLYTSDLANTTTFRYWVEDRAFKELVVEEGVIRNETLHRLPEVTEQTDPLADLRNGAGTLGISMPR